MIDISDLMPFTCFFFCNFGRFGFSEIESLQGYLDKCDFHTSAYCFDFTTLSDTVSLSESMAFQAGMWNLFTNFDVSIPEDGFENPKPARKTENRHAVSVETI